jgi:peptidylprolyl isomerase
MLPRASLVAAALGAAIAIAGCGSGGSSTITVGNENSADNSLIKAGESKSASTTKPSTATVKTPTSGALSKEPTVVPPTGPAPTKLETKDLIAGTGAEAKVGDTITVNDVGVLYKGGKKFESSFKRNEPFTLTLGKGQVIAGWEQGIPGMKVGGRREVIIPAALGYGAKGSPPTIPSNSTLVFVIDLLSA